MEILEEGFGEDFKDIEIVSADLKDEESMANAVHGCDYVIHVASPLPLTTPKNFEKEVIEPAVNGVKYVLQASVRSTVKKVIITSSANTVQDQLKGDGTYGKDSFIKEHKGMNGYYRSKNRSEKFAFDFMRSLSKEDRTFEM
mmetsp:Transcript_9481/g.9238  ORF Transcript_9481/g.9238 Transcript_9481/m.9238 type:complete len:142 (+) Transcript_9481:140-565(+)